jgi:hypothetical protein
MDRDTDTKSGGHDHQYLAARTETHDLSGIRVSNDKLTERRTRDARGKRKLADTNVAYEIALCRKHGDTAIPAIGYTGVMSHGCDLFYCFLIVLSIRNQCAIHKSAKDI